MIRKYIRSPMKTGVLFSNQNFSFRGFGLNISHTGLLVSSAIENNNPDHVDLMFNLRNYPLFSILSEHELEDAFAAQYSFIQFRESANPVWQKKIFIKKKEGLSFVKNLCAYQFNSTSFSLFKFLGEYNQVYTENLKYLLSLFENDELEYKNILKIKKISSLLGHDDQITLPLLRKGLLQEYSNLILS